MPPLCVHLKADTLEANWHKQTKDDLNYTGVQQKGDAG